MLALLLALTLGLFSSPVMAEVLCGKSFSHPAALGIEMLDEPGTELLSHDERYFSIAEDKHQRYWTFTRETHPAHPAAVCRQLKQVDGELLLDMNISCAGPQVACDALAEDFKKLNAAMAADIKRKL